MACQNNGCCSPSYSNLCWVSVYTWDDTPDPDHSDPEWSADHGCPDLPIPIFPPTSRRYLSAYNLSTYILYLLIFLSVCLFSSYTSLKVIWSIGNAGSSPYSKNKWKVFLQLTMKCWCLVAWSGIKLTNSWHITMQTPIKYLPYTPVGNYP